MPCPGLNVVRAVAIGCTMWGAVVARAQTAPTIVAGPQSQAVIVGGGATLTVTATGSGPLSYQWQRNGANVTGATSASLSLGGFQPADAGLYTVAVTSGMSSVTSNPAIVGISTTAKVVGAGSEFAADIQHANGTRYDQILLQGAAAAITADPGQVTRISYLDLTDDIVQLEFSGAGTLTLVLDSPSGPAAPVKYNQAIAYMKGHASILIVGANETTNVGAFSVGRGTAVNQALFRDDVTYDGLADVAVVAIQSDNGNFGGVRTANATYWHDRGFTGLYAPGVQISGPLFVGDVGARGNATPVLRVGSAADARITGGDLLQDNGRAIQVSGITQLRFSPGSTSHNAILPAQGNRARLEQDGINITNRIAALQGFRLPEAAVPPAHSPATLASVQGTYRHLPIENNFHVGAISLKAGSTSLLEWRNQAGVSWNLEPAFEVDRLRTDETNPYQQVPGGDGVDFRLDFLGNELVGFRFDRGYYTKDGSPPLPTALTSGLYGYIQSGVGSVPADYGFGLSFYTTLWALTQQPLNGFQLGLPGTWILPDNQNYTQALLPPDNKIRQSSPERGPTWRSVFQTIEGGPGFWDGTQFASKMAKFRLNSTPDGYDNQLSSPGWAFNSPGPAQAPEVMGIAQLSNRLLIPPDGLTFHAATAGDFFGVAWMALPLTEARPGTTVSVGDKSWTAFFNAANFKGPVAFWVPDTWTRLSQTWAPARGRGLDVLSGVAGGGAMEVNTVPGYQQTDAGGTKYLRIPRLQFPTDSNGVTYLYADWTAYSTAALFTPMRAWLSGGSAITGKFAAGAGVTPAISAYPLSFYQDRSLTVSLSGLADFLETAVVTTPGGGSAFALRWKNGVQGGVFPEYFRQTGSSMQAITASELPAEVKLSAVTFAAPARDRAYTSPAGSNSATWDNPAPVSGPLTVTLNDGSTVTYSWYRFIDQPALKGFNWTAAERARLQANVERIHAGWAASTEFMAPPTGGILATLDAALLVTPPAGCEIGYVPIVIRQSK